jgi:ligand-binding SRPBCC domain-containing protein
VPTYTKSCFIRASVAELYAFHADTRNLPRVQPPGFRVERMELPPQTEVNARTRLTVRILGLVRQYWLIEWVEVAPPGTSPDGSARLVDEMIEGPFPEFRQEHIFLPEGDGARLTDRVIFQPPFRPLGWLLLPALYLQFAFMFEWRHRRTRRLLEQAAGP